jgi:hypothetical protein
MGGTHECQLEACRFCAGLFEEMDKWVIIERHRAARDPVLVVVERDVSTMVQFCPPIVEPNVKKLKKGGVCHPLK